MSLDISLSVWKIVDVACSYCSADHLKSDATGEDLITDREISTGNINSHQDSRQPYTPQNNKILENIIYFKMLLFSFLLDY